MSEVVVNREVIGNHEVAVAVSSSRASQLRYASPAERLAAAQASWLEPARWRLLRRARIAQRRHVLDLGAGHGHVSNELARRSAGTVVAADRCFAQRSAESATAIGRVEADAHALPFADATFDLVFTQCAFLWFANPAQVVREIGRVLAAGGALAAIEPDYGGLMEWPEATAVRALWLAALARAGADPLIGRKMPTLFAARGWQVTVHFLEQLAPPRDERFELLAELPLDAAEHARLAAARQAARDAGDQAVAHLPFWLLVAERH